MRIAFIFLIAVVNFNLWANSIDSKIAEIEKLAIEKMKQSNLSNKEKYFIYNMAGREFYYYSKFDKSAEYYQKAIDTKFETNLSEAYINLIAINLVKKDQTILNKQVELANQYFEKNSNYKTKEIDQYLQMMTNFSKNNFKGEVPAFYGHYQTTKELEKLIKEKNFREAIALLNPLTINDSNNYEMESTYDLLNVLNNRSKVSHLLCAKTLKKYPDSFAYSVIICDNLTFYLKNKKLNPEKIKTLTKYFKEIKPEKSYLLDALLELK